MASKLLAKLFSKPWEVFIQRLLFNFIWVPYIFADIILYFIIGYSFRRGWRREIQEAKSDYRKSAQLVDLWATGRLITLCQPELLNFLYSHKQYIDPNRLLDPEDPYSKALLWSVEREYAVFSLQPDDLTDTRKFPFHIWFMWDLPSQLLLIPHDDFIRLGALMKQKREALPSKPKLVFVHMSARCGSTLLTQVMNSVPGVAAISENWSPLCLYYGKLEGSITKEREQQLLKPTLESILHYIWEKRRSMGETPTHLALKMTAAEIVYAKNIKEIFRDCIQIFNTRQPKPSIKSISKVQNYVFKIPFLVTISGWFMLKVIPASKNNPNLPFKFYDLWKNGAIKTKDIMLCFMSMNYEVALDFKEYFDDTIWYEDLTKYTDITLRRFLTNLKIENVEKALPKALNAMEEDSQGGVITGDAKPRNFLEEDWVTLDSIHEQLGLRLRSFHTEEDMKKLWGNA